MDLRWRILRHRTQTNSFYRDFGKASPARLLTTIQLPDALSLPGKESHQIGKIGVAVSSRRMNLETLFRRYLCAEDGGGWTGIAFMIEWNEQFKTGSDALDQQHRILISNINHLETFLSDTNPTRQSLAFMIHLVDFLESYAKSHFGEEEECMLRHGCPAHAKNKAEHDVFITFIAEFRNSIQHKGLRPEEFKTLHERMSRWIQEHILKVDSRLKPCLTSAH